MFNEAMTSRCTEQMRGFTKSYPHIFDGLNSLVDVGGNTGAAVKIIAKAFPFLRCTVLDLPHVVAEANLEDGSFDVVGGSMLEKIPPAEAFLIKVTSLLSQNFPSLFFLFLTLHIYLL